MAELAAPVALDGERIQLLERHRHVRVFDGRSLVAEPAFTAFGPTDRIAAVVPDRRFHETRFVYLGWVEEPVGGRRSLTVARFRELQKILGERAVVITGLPLPPNGDPHVAQDDEGRLYIAMPGGQSARAALLRFNSDLLGSASPALLATASETLAGRIGFLELTPFLASELAGTRFARDRWFWGGYPPVFQLRDARARAEWLGSYVSTFLERELPLLGLRLPAPRLRTLWTMLTHVHGHVLNVSDLARSLAVSSHTVSEHLDVLEATFMIRRLRPHFANVQKRLTKSAKIYVRDSGLLHMLAGLRRPTDLQSWSRRGHSFEGLVVEELAGLAMERLVRPQIFFWRTQAGAEVDLLVVDGKRVCPLRSSSEPRSDIARWPA
jgi:hypothetical protein